MPFRWTVNPYRGCTHACVYCFARPTHRYLDFDAGRDFEREIVVKVNAPEVLARELARPSWTREHVALGTNTDPYQWVEARYKLMPGIWRALLEHRTPCSVLTKSPLLLRDLPLLARARRARGCSARRCRCRRSTSAPGGRPSRTRRIPRARLEAVAKLDAAGHPDERADRAADAGDQRRPRRGRGDRATARARRARAASRRSRCTCAPACARCSWTGSSASAPDLVARYGELYARGAYAPADERRRLAALVRGDRRARRRAALRAAPPRAARRRRAGARAQPAPHARRRSSLF